MEAKAFLGSIIITVKVIGYLKFINGLYSFVTPGNSSAARIAGQAFMVGYDPGLQLCSIFTRDTGKCNDAGNTRRGDAD